jgi:hypothetical protein
MKLPRRLRKLKTIDIVFPVVLGSYVLWPYWAMHGGPQPPKDMGTVVMGVLGWFGTSKALDVKRTKESVDDDD